MGGARSHTFSKPRNGFQRTIAYASRTLQQHKQNYGIMELEGLRVVWGVKHFRPYLYGQVCDFYDHEALKALLNTSQPSGIPHTCMYKLQVAMCIEFLLNYAVIHVAS